MSQKQIISTPPAEVDINSHLIYQLLQSQHPDLAELPLEFVGSGWDNDMYKLGTDYAIRLPRRKVAVSLLKNEQNWLPILAKQLPIPTPVSWRIGRPEFGYPWTWSILPWIEGEAADLSQIASNQAIPLADFLKSLHTTAPENAPINLNRGVPLDVRAAAIEQRMARLRLKTNLITEKIDAIWAAGLKAEKSTDRLWIHGDLHARNVIVNDGKITGIIDWGDMTYGDVANDLACIWMLLDDPTARATAIETYQPSASLLARARAWAVFFGVVLLETGLVDTPRHAAMGRVTLQRLAED